MRTLQINQHLPLSQVFYPSLLYLYMRFFQTLWLCASICVVSHYPHSNKSSASTPLALITETKFCHFYQTKF